MASKVPGPTGTHQHHHQHGHHGAHGSSTSVAGHADARHTGADATALHAVSLLAGTPRPVAFKFPPKTGIFVRYIHTYTGAPACEVWKNGQRVDPPPRLIRRADPTKNDCFFRVGDTIFCTEIGREGLRGCGFTDPGQSVFTALLFFLLGMDEDRFVVTKIFREIEPSVGDEWRGRVLFSSCLVAGSTVLPFPNEQEERCSLADRLALYEAVDTMVALERVMEAYVGFLIDLVWGLTGGWEVKVAAEVTEKYVAREVMKRLLKFMRPKFVAVVKGYIIGFMKNLVKQVFQSIKYGLQVRLNEKVMPKSTGSGTITVEEIEWLQRSNTLNKSSDLAEIKWWECNTAGIEEALRPFWLVLSGMPMVNGPGSPLGRFAEAFRKYINTFFFDLGLSKAIQYVEGPVGNMLSSTIKKHVAEILTEWAKAVVASPKGMTEEESQSKLRDLTARKLMDGTLIDLAVKWFEDNWEKLAKQGLDKAEAGFVKAVHSAMGGKGGEGE